MYLREALSILELKSIPASFPPLYWSSLVTYSPSIALLKASKKGPTFSEIKLISTYLLSTTLLSQIMISINKPNKQYIYKLSTFPFNFQTIQLSLISNLFPSLINCCDDQLMMMYRAEVMRSRHTNLILPIFGEILHPRRSLVPRTVHDLQVTHLEAWNCEERNLKVDIDRLLLIEVSLRRLNCRQFKICT